MARFNPSKEELALTGVFGASNGHGKPTPGKYYAPDAMSPISWHTASKSIKVDPISNGRTQLFERTPDDSLVNTGYSSFIKNGQSVLKLEHQSYEIRKGSFTLYRNGGEALIEGTDYYYDEIRSEIHLRKPIKDTDDDVEVRYLYFKGIVVNEVLLLSRGEFTEEQMEAFLPDHGALFNIDRLIPNNPELFEYTDRKAVLIQASIVPEGIIGNLQLYHKNEELL